MNPSLEKINTPFDGLYALKRKVISDSRGFFYRLFCKESLQELGLDEELSQINFSHASEKFTTRGFHFQKNPNSENKIVTCVQGEIFDVAIDLRVNSPTFLKWFGTVLSEKNLKSMFIPAGYAHATQSLTEKSSVVYLHSKKYSPENEGGINVLDPLISVEWPHTPYNLSARDKSFPYLKNDFKGIETI